MNAETPRKESGRNALSEDERQLTSAKCSFCWFVLTVYPALKGMTERDNSTFSEHLKKAHGLREEIRE